MNNTHSRLDTDSDFSTPPGYEPLNLEQYDGAMKYPPGSAPRPGSPRDLELTRLDEERCERVRAWFKRVLRAVVNGWRGK